jgi:tetratricopeptide (TPR) repeat protein
MPVVNVIYLLCLNTGFGGALSGQNQVDGMSVMSLMGCTLRAVLQGYRSESVDLGRVRLGDSPVTGTIILHRLAGVQGVSVSATGLSAPRNARNALEKARQHTANGQLADAEKEFNAAVRLHPKYAEAWQELGSVKNWQDTLDRCAALLRLNPYEYPQAYYYQAAAHYNLENNGEKEHCSRKPRAA